MSDEPMVARHEVSYQFVDGHFYCDGIKVHPAQMTRAEILKYIPKDFQPTYLKAIGEEVALVQK